MRTNYRYIITKSYFLFGIRVLFRLFALIWVIDYLDYNSPDWTGSDSGVRCLRMSDVFVSTGQVIDLYQGVCVQELGYSKPF